MVAKILSDVQIVGNLTANNLSGTNTGDGVGVRTKLTGPKTYYVGEAFPLPASSISVASPCVVSTINQFANDEPIALHCPGFREPVTIGGTVPMVITQVNAVYKTRAVGALVKFSTTGKLPTGITAGTIYSISPDLYTTNVFRLKTYPGGATVTISGTQSGTHFIESAGTLPTGLSEGVTYYVKNRTDSSFQLAATPGGAAINTSGSAKAGDWTVSGGRDVYSGTGPTNGFRTIQKAIDTIVSTLDLNGFDVTIQVQDGYYIGNTAIGHPLVGGAAPGNSGGQVVINGNSSYPGNVIITTPTSGGTHALTVAGASVKASNVKFTTPNYCVLARAHSDVTLDNVVFGAAAIHMIATLNSSITMSSNWTVDGSATIHINVRDSLFTAVSRSCTFIGACSFTIFLIAERLANANVENFAYTGTVYGKRFSVSENSIIRTYMSSRSALPGNQDGTESSGGIYEAWVSGGDNSWQSVNSPAAYYVGCDLGPVTITAGATTRITKTAHGLRELDQITLSIPRFVRQVTFSIASPCVVTNSGHGIPVGNPIYFTSTGSVPTGITPGTTYYVIAAGYTTSTFQFSLTPGGAAVNSSGTQSGTHYVYRTGSLPTGLAEGTNYDITIVDDNTFDLFAASSGTATGVIHVRCGSDYNDGLAATSGKALWTVNAALAKLKKHIPAPGEVSYIYLCDGSYAEDIVCVDTYGYGGTVVIVGNTYYPDNVMLNNGAGDTFTVNGLLTKYKLRGVFIRSVNVGLYYGIVAKNRSYLELSDVSFGEAGCHILAQDAAFVEFVGNYNIRWSNAVQHIFGAGGGMVRIPSGVTITITGTPSFSDAFVKAKRLANIFISLPTFAGTFTGKRYDIAGNAVIDTGGTATTYFPGTVAGTTATGGQYT